MIHARLIEHTKNAKVCKALFENGELLLSKALTITVNIERAAECATTLAKKGPLSAKQPP